MSDVFCVVSQWHCVNNLVTHPVPIHPIHGPVIHEAVHLLNKTCPTDKTGESPWVKRGQNLLHIWKQQSKLPQRDPQTRRAPGQSHRMPRSVSSLVTQSRWIFFFFFLKKYKNVSQRQEGHTAAGVVRHVVQSRPLAHRVLAQSCRPWLA